jgi:hypothetical protein
MTYMALWSTKGILNIVDTIILTAKASLDNGMNVTMSQCDKFTRKQVLSKKLTFCFTKNELPWNLIKNRL